MRISLHVADSSVKSTSVAADGTKTETFDTYDLSQVVESVDWKLTMLAQPGELNFTYRTDPSVKISNGSNVIFQVDGVTRFNGFVFRVRQTEAPLGTVRCYDRTRYLSNKDSFTFNGDSLSTMFTKICKLKGLPHTVKWGPDRGLPAHVFDNVSLADMLNWGIDQTLTLDNDLYVVYDDCGTLVLDNVKAMDTDILFGDGLALTGWDFGKTIDTGTYNVVKLVREATDNQQREVVVKSDAGTVAKWGQLQYFEKVKEDLSVQQMNDRAAKLLALHNRETRTLTVETVGVARVIAANGIGIRVGALDKEGFGKGVTTFVESVHHQIRGEEYTMTLELAVP